MKIKYETATGVVICVGSMPDLQAGAGETVEEFSGIFPNEPVNYYKRTALNTIVKRDKSEIDALPENLKKSNMTADKTSFSSHDFYNMTPAQVDAWVDSNFLLLDLATTKDTFKKIIKALVYLIRRSDLK